MNVTNVPLHSRMIVIICHAIQSDANLKLKRMRRLVHLSTTLYLKPNCHVTTSTVVSQRSR